MDGAGVGATDVWEVTDEVDTGLATVVEYGGTAPCCAVPCVVDDDDWPSSADGRLAPPLALDGSTISLTDCVRLETIF